MSDVIKQLYTGTISVIFVSPPLISKRPLTVRSRKGTAFLIRTL